MSDKFVKVGMAIEFLDKGIYLTAGPVEPENFEQMLITMGTPEYANLLCDVLEQKIREQFGEQALNE